MISLPIIQLGTLKIQIEIHKIETILIYLTSFQRKELTNNRNSVNRLSSKSTKVVNGKKTVTTK